MWFLFLYCKSFPFHVLNYSRDQWSWRHHPGRRDCSDTFNGVQHESLQQDRLCVSSHPPGLSTHKEERRQLALCGCDHTAGKYCEKWSRMDTSLTLDSPVGHGVKSFLFTSKTQRNNLLFVPRYQWLLSVLQYSINHRLLHRFTLSTLTVKSVFWHTHVIHEFLNTGHDETENVRDFKLLLGKSTVHHLHPSIYVLIPNLKEDLTSVGKFPKLDLGVDRIHGLQTVSTRDIQETQYKKGFEFWIKTVQDIPLRGTRLKNHWCHDSPHWGQSRQRRTCHWILRNKRISIRLPSG